MCHDKFGTVCPLEHREYFVHWKKIVHNHVLKNYPAFILKVNFPRQEF